MERHDTLSPSTQAPSRRVGRLLWGGAAVLVAVAAILVFGRVEARRAADAREPPPAPLRTLAVVRATEAGADGAVHVPGTVQAAQSAVIIAKADGYVGQLRVDIGDKVEAGALLLTIEAPEVAQELRVARARLAEARSNIDLARSTMERNEGLASQGAASKQEAEDARARYHSAQAAVGTGVAEARRLETLVQYQRVTAPFTGTVVRRWVDPGAFAQSGTTRLVEVAETATLDVVADVPQSLAGTIEPGMKVEVSGREPGTVMVEGEVLRSAGALDPQTRTLRVKIRVPGGGQLVPGSYVRVKLDGKTAARPVRIPANALVVGKEGTSVALVQAGRVLRRPIAIVRDLGKELEVEGAVAAGSAVVLSPPADLVDGERVNILDRSGAQARAQR